MDTYRQSTPPRPRARPLHTYLLTVVLAAVAGLTTTLAPSEARADLLLTWAVGGKAGMNLNLLGEPSETPIDLPVPGFVGVSGGGGFAGELLWADIVGLEVDVLYVKTRGEGSVTLTFPGGQIDTDQTLETTELQIPVLLKAQLPFGVVKPFIGLGWTFVNQLDADYTIEPEGQILTESEGLAQNYSMLTLALGAVVDLPYVRVPIEARGMYQSISDDPRERTEFDTTGGTLNSLVVKPTWEGQVWILIGVQYSDGLDT